jgi:L-serine dehydratase
MGPWRAALAFVRGLEERGRLGEVRAVRVALEGSLAKTGAGHGTPLAVQMGLSGASFETIDVEQVPAVLDAIRRTGRLRLAARHEVPFDPERDLSLRESPPGAHPNTLELRAVLADGAEVAERWVSLGGGFIVREGAEETDEPERRFPFPIDRPGDLLRWCRETGSPVEEVVRRNEATLREPAALDAGLDRIWEVMLGSVYEGCQRGGVLPGGLGVHRRAAAASARLLAGCCHSDRESWLACVRAGPRDMATVTDWVTTFALAVNEVNASFGRIVTAPTNGAAGVVPAVLLYHLCFGDAVRPGDVRRFLLVAGEVGSLFKKGATLSAAMGGCQAEIGVSSAMAAAGLAACGGGSAEQVLAAAEIAMEHHLGLTCDPVGGLVQIPCIERNAMGATKAIVAARMALQRDPGECCVSLEAVIHAMRETARDMSARYKETSEGGLAIAVPLSSPEC